MDGIKLTERQMATRWVAWMMTLMWGMFFAAPTQAQTASVTPASLTFASTAVGNTSASQSVAVRNSGNRTMNIGAVNITGNNAGSFITTTTCTATLAAGRTCNYNVSFRPQAQGALTATLNISNNGTAGGVSRVSLSGTGAPPLPVLVVAPTTVAFGNGNLNVTNGPRTVTISNTGQGTLSFTAAPSITAQTAGAGFVISATTCGASVSPGLSCTLSVTFRPTTAGAKTGTLAIRTNGSPTTLNVALSGTGVTPTPLLVVSPTSVAFGNAAVNVTSGPRTVTVSNNGLGVLNFSAAPAITVQTAGAGFLISSNGCNVPLNPGLSCTINVTFTPTTTGAKTGTLAIRSNGSPATLNVALSGTSVTPTPVLTLTPSTTTLTCSNPYGGPVFASIGAANTGTANVVLGAITFTGTGASFFSQTNLCPNPLVPGAACSIAVKFSPTGKTSRTATMTVNSNGGNRTVALTGSCPSHPSP